MCYTIKLYIYIRPISLQFLRFAIRDDFDFIMISRKTLLMRVFCACLSAVHSFKFSSSSRKRCRSDRARLYCCFYNTYKFYNARHKSEFWSVNVIFWKTYTKIIKETLTLENFILFIPKNRDLFYIMHVTWWIDFNSWSSTVMQSLYTLPCNQNWNKIHFFLCTTWRCMEELKYSATHSFFNLGTGWRRMVSFTPQRLDYFS